MSAVTSSKALVRDLFALKELTTIPFIPWVSSFAAQLEQIQIEEMFSDAGALSKSLINAQKLFGYDAIVNIFDPTLEAEACHCRIDWGGDGELPCVASHPLAEGATLEGLDIPNFLKRGRIPIVLDATKRMIAIRGKEVAVVGMITGPITLARHLKGDAFIEDLNQGSEDTAKLVAITGSLVLKLCRSYCELGVDIIAVAEDMLSQIDPRQYQLVASPLRSIWNVVKYYNVHSLLLSKGCRDDQVEPILGLQADGIALAGKINYAELAGAAQARKSCYSRAIPNLNLLDEPSRVEVSIADLCSTRGKGFFLSTEWEVPFAAKVDMMHKSMSIVRGNL